MSGLACLLAAQLVASSPCADSHHHGSVKGFCRGLSRTVADACGWTPSPWRSGRYHFGATARIAATAGLVLGSFFPLASALTRFVWAALGL